MLYFEKVSPSHPDKIADRIAGALVDLAYLRYDDPHIAVEVLIGHGICHIIAETDTKLEYDDVEAVVHRIAGKNITLDYKDYGQDDKLRRNQNQPHCGDNGIFKGMPLNQDYQSVADAVYEWYKLYPYDSKFIRNFRNDTFIACQSHYDEKIGTPGYKTKIVPDFYPATAGATHIQLNPLGNWTGGIDVDTGATNRKLGSDLGDAVTGGGIHGKDLSKADVSINIMCHVFAHEFGRPICACCAIGDASVTFSFEDDGKNYKTIAFADVMTMAKSYVLETFGSFERLAMWGLIAPEKFLKGEM